MTSANRRRDIPNFVAPRPICPSGETLSASRERAGRVTIGATPSSPIPRLTTALSSITALLLSVVLLIGGNALIGVTTPLRGRIEGFSDLTVGLLGSAYFAGMLAGTLAAPAAHTSRRTYPGFRRLRRAGGGFRRAHAGIRVAMGLACLPRSHRICFRRNLCGHRSLDQRKGDQLQPRRPLCSLPDREFQRIRRRPDGCCRRWDRPASPRLRWRAPCWRSPFSRWR